MNKRITIIETSKGYDVLHWRNNCSSYEPCVSDAPLHTALKEADRYFTEGEHMECKSKDCNHIKVGDEVKVTDGSWAERLIHDELREIHGIEMDKDLWKVVATGLVLSGRHGFQKRWSPNDTIIYSNCRTVFIRHQFLEVQDAPYVKCERCGARIGLS